MYHYMVQNIFESGVVVVEFSFDTLEVPAWIQLGFILVPVWENKYNTLKGVFQVINVICDKNWGPPEWLYKP